jgi:WD40 repeat protein
VIPIPLDFIISTITDVVNPTAFIKDKLERNETVIKLLKKFNLDPEKPPADFSGIYAYTLVEYGVGKPKLILELFRQPEIQEAFHKAFDKNNPSILLQEGEAFLDGYALGDEIRNLGIDTKREFAAFAAVFIEVAKRTRTPAEVIASQQLGSLNKRLSEIHERLDRLSTLEGIRTEIARLAAQNYPALPAAESSIAENCKAFALAQQIKGWFETLGYRFEKYEIWEATHFELIINIQVRRNRYDRILVRGIEGEVGVKDIAALRQSVETQKTDEGWLVTARRISKAARDEVEKEENRRLDCYTFDELLDQDADFSGYLNWLEAEIKCRNIETKYVPLACTKEELDPFTKRRLAVSRYEEEDGWIDGYIDLWLDDPAKEHISILGEFGTGKTWFVLHYAWTALQRYREAQKRGLERPRLPLVIPLRDYAKAVSVESLFSEFFFRKHEIPLAGYSAFEQLNRMGKLLLIFDGFDEMAARVDRQGMINNFWELAKVVVPGAKVILTCRTEHFPEAKEGRALLNAELQASTSALDVDTPQFEVVELEKFNDEQIRQVLSHQTKPATVQQIMGNPQLLDLARRPVMTELILEALPDIEAGKPVDMSRVYLYAVRRKMERDIKAERTFTSLADKLYFLCELSWEMLSTDQLTLNYRLFPDVLRRLFSTVVQEEKDLDHWHYDMMGQTMLIRNSDGDYTPAHRSLLEFFVAYKFAAQLGVLASDFTELAQLQSHLESNATPQNYTWSSYFGRRVDGFGRILQIPPLGKFTSESLDKLRDSFGVAPLTKAVIDLLIPMIDSISPPLLRGEGGDLNAVVDDRSPQPPLVRGALEKSLLLEILEATQGKTEDEVGYIGGNAATLLVKVDKVALENRDLSRTVLQGADFTCASLRRVNFAEANLTNAVFTKILGSVKSVAFSPDSKLLATADSNGFVRLWEAINGREILTCKGHTDLVNSVVFSPDGKILASGSYDQTIKLWDIKTGICLTTFQGHTDSVFSVAFSPDGEILASGSYDKTARIWDIKTGNCLKILQGHTKVVTSVAFNVSGQILASGSGDKTVRFWDVNTGECQKILQAHTDCVKSVSYSPDGEIFATGGDDQVIKIWDIQTGKCQQILQGHTHRVESITFTPSGKILASASFDQTVRLWDISTGQCQKILQGHSNPVWSVAFCPSGNILASGSYDQTVRCWDSKSGECVSILQGHSNQIRSVAFSPCGQILMSGSYDKIIRLWDVNTGQCFKNLQGHTDQVQSVAFSPCGQIIASGSRDKTVRLWDVSSGECLKILQGHTNFVYSVAFSPCGQILASTSPDKTVRLWNIHTGICLKVLSHPSTSARSIAFSPDGKLLASNCDKTVKIWDVRSGECLKTLQGHTNNCLYSVAFSPDSEILASASYDQTVRLWNIHTGECLKILPHHSFWVRSVVFSPNGKVLASSCASILNLWDVSTGENLKTLQAHNSRINSVVFSPDGKIIVTGSKDGKIKLWDVKTGNRLKILITDRLYEAMNITGVTSLTQAEKATLKALGAVESSQ